MVLFLSPNRGFLSIKCWRKVVAGKRFVTAKFAVGRSRNKKVQWTTTLTNHQDHSFILSQTRKGNFFFNFYTINSQNKTFLWHLCTCAQCAGKWINPQIAYWVCILIEEYILIEEGTFWQHKKLISERLHKRCDSLPFIILQLKNPAEEHVLQWRIQQIQSASENTITNRQQIKCSTLGLSANIWS